MAKNQDITGPPWWTLAQMLVWILQRLEIPPQDAEQFCTLNPKIIEVALNVLIRALFDAIYGAVEGLPVVAARVLCGHRYEDLAVFFQLPPSLAPGSLDVQMNEMRRLIGEPGVEFNPIWGKRTWPVRAPAAQTVPTPTRPTESAVADKAESIPSSAIGSEESQPPNKPDSVDAPTPAGPVRINVGGDPAIGRALTYALKRARPAYTADAPIVAENVESLSNSPVRSGEAKAPAQSPALKTDAASIPTEGASAAAKRKPRKKKAQGKIAEAAKKIWPCNGIVPLDLDPADLMHAIEGLYKREAAAKGPKEKPHNRPSWSTCKRFLKAQRST